MRSVSGHPNVMKTAFKVPKLLVKEGDAWTTSICVFLYDNTIVAFGVGYLLVQHVCSPVFKKMKWLTLTLQEHLPNKRNDSRDTTHGNDDCKRRYPSVAFIYVMPQ